MKDEGLGSHADVLSVYPPGCIASMSTRLPLQLLGFFLCCSQMWH